MRENKGFAPVKDKRRFKNRLGYIVSNVKQEFWDASALQTKPILVRFFNNIQYLIDVNGLSQDKVSKGIYDRFGFCASSESISRFKHKETFVSAELRYLSAFSLFFGEPLDKLLYIDYEEEARQKAGLTETM